MREERIDVINGDVKSCAGLFCVRNPAIVARRRARPQRRLREDDILWMMCVGSDQSGLNHAEAGWGELITYRTPD